MSQTDVRHIEENIREARKILELNTALQRLQSNRDFVRVIAQGYLRDESIRLVMLKADPSMQTPERQASIVRDIDAIGSLASFFRTVAFNGELAKKSIEAGESEIEEIRSEGDDA